MYYVKEPRNRINYKKIVERLQEKTPEKPKQEVEFSYDERDGNGPSKWKYLAFDCGGIRQSPMPIERSQAILAPSAEAFEAIGMENLPIEIDLENTGHSAKFKFIYKAGQTPVFSGGPLNGFYSMDHIHFHWGVTNE